MGYRIRKPPENLAKESATQRVLHLWKGAESEGRARKEDKWPDVGVSQEVRGKRISYSPIDVKRCTLVR